MLETTIVWWLMLYCVDKNSNCQFFDDYYGGRFNTEKECIEWANKIGQWLYDISEAKIEYTCKPAPLKHPNGIYVPFRRGKE